MLRQTLSLLAGTVLLLSCGPSGPEESALPADGVASAGGSATVVSVDGVEIAYTVHGEGEPTLVLVHGWMCDQTLWDLVVGPL